MSTIENAVTRRVTRSAVRDPIRDLSNPSSPTMHSTEVKVIGGATNPYYGKTESLHYDHEESVLWQEYMKTKYDMDSKGVWPRSQRSTFLTWFTTFLVGAVCGLVAVGVSKSVRTLSAFKFDLFNDLIEQEKSGQVPAGFAFAILLLINVAFGSLAWFSVYMEPVAGGSGIPEVKCYLNGLNIPRLLRIRTLFYKVFGIIMSCASGLPVGKEGSMVHAGAVVAGVLSQGKCKLLDCSSVCPSQQDLRNDKEKRDFVACGAAAGVAAAFGSPVGGVLFSLEEGASFWSTKLTLRCFFCGSTAVFILLCYKTADALFGHSLSAAMFSFGEFFSLHSNRSNFAVWELSMFVLLGILGGFIGAIFNISQDKVFKFRSCCRKPALRYIEVVCLICTMTLISYGLPSMWNTCTPIPTVVLGRRGAEQELELRRKLVPLYCHKATHYNELASLYLVDPDTSIRQLYHFREEGDQKSVDGTGEWSFSSSALSLFFFPYIIMTCITFGSGVAAGSFVPSLLSGAAFGRLVGHILHQIDNVSGTFADSGTYALMGSAAITGGITRLTISLVVVILEATGDMQYVLPLMLVIMSAVFVGKIFVPGLYDVYINNRELHFLEEEEMIPADARIYDNPVSKIMTKTPICLHSKMVIGDVISVLAECNFHCFPVVENNSMTLLGSLSRKVLCVGILRKVGAANGDFTNSTEISIEEILTLYPKYPDIDDLLRISAQDKNEIIDVTQLMDQAPFTINVRASVGRAYKMFRTLGLRHLLVVSGRNEVVGIVARAELVESHLHECIADSGALLRGERRFFDKKAYSHLDQTERVSFDEYADDSIDRSSLRSDGKVVNIEMTSGHSNGHGVLGRKNQIVKENDRFFDDDDNDFLK